MGRTIATGGDDKRRDPRASNDKIDLTGATRDESLPRHRRGVTDPQALEARHDLSCAALAHTEELLDRRAVEVSGCHGTQGAEDFVKSMKPGWLGGHGRTPALLYVRERSGIMEFSEAAGGGAYHA